MDTDDRKLLDKVLSLTEENNKLLKKMRRSQQIASFMRVLYWIIILGVTFGAFYLLQPYVEQVVNMYNSVSNTSQKINGTLDSVTNVDVGGLLEQFKKQ